MISISFVVGIFLFAIFIAFALYWLTFASVFVAGAFWMYHGQRRGGTMVLLGWTIWALGPIALQEWRAVTMRAEIDSFATLPDGLSVRGANVVFPMSFPNGQVCSVSCRFAMEAGTVAVYTVLTEDVPFGGSGGTERPDYLYRIERGPDGSFRAEAVASPDDVRIDYVVSFRLPMLSNQRPSSPALPELSIGTNYGGTAIFDGWPAEGGEIVSIWTNHTFRPSMHGWVLVGQRPTVYLSAADRNLRARTFWCGAELTPEDTQCPFLF